MARQGDLRNHREGAMEQNAEAQTLQGAGGQTQKPVAYDPNGNPLYAAPPEQMPAHPAQVVHITRATEPLHVAVSEEAKQRHSESMKAFPSLNLSEHEYVVNAVRRHPIGMWGPLFATALSISLVFILVINYPYLSDVMGLPISMYGTVLLMGTLMTILFLIGGYLAVWVYTNNRFFLTNESVVQEIQASIFSRKEQTVSLLNIEDASYSKRGPLQTILDYGSIRLSTEGEETTYRVDYVANPKRQIAILSNAVEAFKNGRPVDFDTGSDT